MSLVTHTSAWAGQIPRIDLSWPPISNQRDIVIGGILIAPVALSSTDAFPCANVSIPDNVTRTDFPLQFSNGSPQFTFSSSDIPISYLEDDYSWLIEMYLGQFDGNITEPEILRVHWPQAWPGTGQIADRAGLQYFALGDELGRDRRHFGNTNYPNQGSNDCGRDGAGKVASKPHMANCAREIVRTVMLIFLPY
jgi:hypothetical protein